MRETDAKSVHRRSLGRIKNTGHRPSIAWCMQAPDRRETCGLIQGPLSIHRRCLPLGAEPVSLLPSPTRWAQSDLQPDLRSLWLLADAVVVGDKPWTATDRLLFRTSGDGNLVDLVWGIGPSPAFQVLGCLRQRLLNWALALLKVLPPSRIDRRKAPRGVEPDPRARPLH